MQDMSAEEIFGLFFFFFDAAKVFAVTTIINIAIQAVILRFILFIKKILLEAGT